MSGSRPQVISTKPSFEAGWDALIRRHAPDALEEGVGRSRRVGDVRDFRNFMNAVIDEDAFTSITEYIEIARSDPHMDILCGGTYDDSEGYFIDPTVVETRDPRFSLMNE